MAKRTKKADKAEVSSAIQGLAAACRKKFGAEGVYQGAEHGKFFRGLPLQCLALEYLFGSDKLVLGMVYGISGPPQSFKSALMLDFGRLIGSCGGSSILVETEGRKISPSMLEAIYGETLVNRLLMRPVTTVDDAQETLTFGMKWEKKEFPKKDNLLGLMVDSLVGSSTAERKTKVDKEGSAQRDFSSEALMWASWLKSKASEFSGWPMVLMYVTHEKPKVGDVAGHGHAVSRGGGSSQEFYASTYLSVRRGKEQKGSGKTLTQIVIKTVKQSLGEFGRKINALFEYDFSDPSNILMHFDWESTTAQLLLEQQARVKDVIKVTSTSESVVGLTRTFNSTTLGLSAVTGKELGAAVHANPELMADLRQKLGIRSYEEWDGIMPVVENPPVDDPEVASEITVTSDDVELDM